MLRIALTLVTIAAMVSMQPARAETEADRLRDAVRSLTGQLRLMEDQRAQAQAKLAQTEREKVLAVQAAERLRGQLKDAQKALQDAVEEFNKRLANRDETLEKWKAAYGEAAQVAQEKDALRAKFEGEAGVFKARTKSCEAKNLQLLKLNSEVLAAYRDLTPLDAGLIKEPLIGFSRVEHQNRVQDLHDKILDQDVRIPAVPVPPVPAAATGEKAGEAKKDGAAKSDGRKSTDPKTTGPKATDPKSTDPKSTDPKSTGPKSRPAGGQAQNDAPKP